MAKKAIEKSCGLLPLLAFVVVALMVVVYAYDSCLTSLVFFFCKCIPKRVPMDFYALFSPSTRFLAEGVLKPGFYFKSTLFFLFSVYRRQIGRYSGV